MKYVISLSGGLASFMTAELARREGIYYRHQCKRCGEIVYICYLL